MENQVNISEFFAQKVIAYLNCVTFYTEIDTDKLYDQIKKSCENDFKAICQKTKTDILAIREKYCINDIEEKVQLVLFDKNIASYIAFKVAEVEKTMVK